MIKLKDKSVAKQILIGLSAFIGIVIIIGLVTGLSLLSSRNQALSLEQQIQAQEIANKSDYDNMWKKFEEMTQVTDIQSKQIQDTYKGIISGRYNDTGLLFKAVQEDNPKLDTTVYTELQREIAASREEFNYNQMKIADMVREYNTYIGKHFIMAAITGRTNMDANKLVVTSDKTDNTFTTGKSDAIDLTGK